jgi:hypothetical protein
MRWNIRALKRPCAEVFMHWNVHALNCLATYHVTFTKLKSKMSGAKFKLGLWAFNWQKQNYNCICIFCMYHFQRQDWIANQAEARTTFKGEPRWDGSETPIFTSGDFNSGLARQGIRQGLTGNNLTPNCWYHYSRHSTSFSTIFQRT